MRKQVFFTISTGILLATTLAAADIQSFLIIGVDGLSTRAITAGHAPRIRELMSRGAWTLKARGVMPTLSSPNWASMINGAGPEQHGITSNGWFKPMVEMRPVCRGSGDMFPTVFDVLRSQRPEARITVFHHWAGFADLVERRVPDVLEHHGTAGKTMDAALRDWATNPPVLGFIHLDNVDHAGHLSGWHSKRYNDAVKVADEQIGRMIDMLEQTGRLEITMVLITADHGGHGHGHGKNSLEDLEIPWILNGPGVVKGEIRQSVNTFDTAATVASMLRLEPPKCWIGRTVNWAAPPVSVATNDGSGN